MCSCVVDKQKLCDIHINDLQSEKGISSIDAVPPVGK